MRVEPVFTEGVFLIKPSVYKDERGFFCEFFNRDTFEKETGIKVNFVQDNLSQSSKNVLRGFHFQLKPYEQAKLVSVLKGAVLDVIVDLRKDSKTFGQYFSVELNEENKYQLFIPKGFAHAYLALQDDTLFFYKTDHFYHKKAEAGIIYNDPDIGMFWPIDNDKIIISEKDKNLRSFSEISKNL